MHLVINVFTIILLLTPNFCEVQIDVGSVVSIVLSVSCIRRSYLPHLFFFRPNKIWRNEFITDKFFVAEAIIETQRGKYERKERNDRAREGKE
jgi:hypothetical protein